MGCFNHLFMFALVVSCQLFCAGTRRTPYWFNIQFVLLDAAYRVCYVYMNGTHQVLAYADNGNLIGGNIRTIETNADVLLNACKDVGLAVNIGKTKYMEIGSN